MTCRLFRVARFACRRRVSVLFSMLSITAAVAACAATTVAADIAPSGDALRYRSKFLDVAWSGQQPALLSLSVDSLGKAKFLANALRVAPAAERWNVSASSGADRVVAYRRAAAAAGSPPAWRIEHAADRLRIVSQWDAAAPAAAPLSLEFDPKHCHATLLGLLHTDGSARLPALLHLPDQGTLRITCKGRADGRLLYDARRAGAGYVRIAFPPADREHPRVEYTAQAVAVYPKLPTMEGDARFDGFRRNWLNIFQINPRLRVLANHAASDSCAFCLYEYADIARHTPPLADNLTALDLIRESVNRYLDGMPGYGLPGYVGFDIGGPPSKDPPYMDSYPSLLIAAAEYVDGTGDRKWLAAKYPGLRDWAEKMLATDRDGNGLLEYPYSGNSNSWSGKGEKRPSNWWDCIGFGHEDAYGNALAYRALRSTAWLARRNGAPADAARYDAAADRLRTAFYPTFYNPGTGMLAGWKSADGQLHDYAFLFVAGIAVEYGLVPETRQAALIDRVLARFREVGYTRFDLGLPGNLVCIPRKDYVHLDPRWGGGKREDNADGFQRYENAGATACFAYFTLAALYDANRQQDADGMLMPMLASFEAGAFQGQRADGMSYDWKAWDGTPWGYEGFLVDNYYTLLAVLKREGALKRPAFWEPK